MRHDDAIEKFTHNGRTVLILRDDDPINPRKDYDNLSTFACWHRRSNLGDRQIRTGSDVSDCRTKEGMVATLIAEGEKVLAILPLYLYEHSGMTISTGPFSCSFDSGQVGWAYVTEASAEAMGCVGDYHGPEGGTWDEKRLEENIRGEVETYDQYLTGQVYGYVVQGMGGDEIDSCWGFIGDLPYVRQAAKDAADHSDDPAVASAVEALEARGTYAAGAPWY